MSRAVATRCPSPNAPTTSLGRSPTEANGCPTRSDASDSARLARIVAFAIRGERENLKDFAIGSLADPVANDSSEPGEQGHHGTNDQTG